MNTVVLHVPDLTDIPDSPVPQAFLAIPEACELLYARIEDEFYVFGIEDSSFTPQSIPGHFANILHMTSGAGDMFVSICEQVNAREYRVPLTLLKDFFTAFDYSYDTPLEQRYRDAANQPPRGDMGPRARILHLVGKDDTDTGEHDPELGQALLDACDDLVRRKLRLVGIVPEES